MSYQIKSQGTAEEKRQQRMIFAAKSGVPLELIAKRFQTYPEAVKKVLEANNVEFKPCAPWSGGIATESVSIVHSFRRSHR